MSFLVACSDDDANLQEAPPTLQALVHAPDPITTPNVTQVELPKPTDIQGLLQNHYVRALNCLNKEGGEPITFRGEVYGSHCVWEQTATPDVDGNYLVAPPADVLDPNDVFAEIQMYYHVNVVHDYYAQNFGVTHMDFPLTSLTNQQSYYDVPGQSGWEPYDNAAYMYPQSFELLGMEPVEGGAILFGQGTYADFSYDASIIYHEYLHAVVGDGLSGLRLDSLGLDNLSGAINEGLADYFAASLVGQPLLGRYGLGAFGEERIRDLSDPRQCPGDLATQVHTDGKIIGSAFWRLRGELGAEIADFVAYRALASLGADSSFEDLGQAVIAEMGDVAPQFQEQTRTILRDHGVIGCQRVKPWVPYDFQSSSNGVPYQVAGTWLVGSPALAEWVPGYLQFFAELPATAAGARLSWTAVSYRGPRELGLAVAAGQTVKVVSGVGHIELDADATFEVELTGTSTPRQSVVLGADCFAQGQAYTLFYNRGGGSRSVVWMDVQYLDQAQLEAEGGGESCSAGN